MKIFYFYFVKIKFFTQKFFKLFLLTKFHLVSTKFYHILLSFTSSGTKSYQIPVL